MSIRYYDMSEDRGRLTFDVTQQQAEDLWRLAHAHLADDEEIRAGGNDLVDAMIVGLEIGLKHPLEQYPAPKALPMTLRRETKMSEVERLEQPVVELHPHRAKSGRKPLMPLLEGDLVEDPGS